MYKKHRHVVTTLMQQLATDMRLLFEQGITLESGERIFGACVAIKGDLDFFQKYMELTRSYSSLGVKNKYEICHLCRAGCEQYPFEDYAEDPRWVESMLCSRPWDVQNPPPLSEIPCDRGNPEAIIAHDVFHIVKVGVGRDVIGGVLIFLLRKGFFDHPGSTKNIDDRFERSYSVFSMWCQAERHTPGLQSFTKSFFNMKNMMSAPWASSKASDTRLLLKWLVWFLRLNLKSPSVSGFDQHLKHMLEVCESTLDINLTHHHGLWLERACAQRLYTSMMTCLRGYAYLGTAAIRYGIRSFIQKPKQHALHHVAHKLKKQLLKGATLVCSPQTFACDVNEDFIGRISRLSRRVGFRLCDLRVSQRYCLKIAALLRKKKRPGLHGKLAFSKAKQRGGARLNRKGS